jgi:hypothetical protein
MGGAACKMLLLATLDSRRHRQRAEGAGDDLGSPMPPVVLPNRICRLALARVETRRQLAQFLGADGKAVMSRLSSHRQSLARMLAA